VPANAAHAAAAMVVANELLDPSVQLALFEANGAYPAIDPAKLPAEQRAAFDAVELGPAVLPLTELTASTQPELPAAYISRIEAGWKSHVLQQ
ncbi:MAG: ABC transporter substrate-binding protein, partial [Actinomycetota bacterium]|nr:ABC transporter substrate-binding protein [Actinomycetota bacterium]